MNSLPREWQLEPHYQPSLRWFSREPQSQWLLGQKLPPPDESEEYPGWYFLQRGDTMRMVDSLEEALPEIKSCLKHWKLVGLLGQGAPYQASKRERKQMLAELLQMPIACLPANYDPDRDEPLPPLLECKWELGPYLLVATIEYTPFRPGFDTYFGKANNPIRSLVGRVYRLEAATQADLEREADVEDFEAEWKEISSGTVSLEENRLTVGFWSRTFDPSTAVLGVAYEEASFEDEEFNYYLHSEVQP